MYTAALSESLVAHPELYVDIYILAENGSRRHRFPRPDVYEKGEKFSRYGAK